MFASLSPADVKNVVTGFNKIVARKTTVPVLAHLLFDRGSDGRLHVTGTNLEEMLTLKLNNCLPDTNAGDTPFLVSLESLRSMAKILHKDDRLDIASAPEQDTLVCTITSAGQRTSSHVPTLPVGDFPAGDEADGKSACAVARLDEFLSAYRRAAVCAATDPSRNVLCGVFWDADDGVLVGTDGRRLAAVGLPGFRLESSLILPATRFLLQHPAGCSVEAGFRTADTDTHPALYVSCTDWDYKVRCVDGTYPNYRQVIPDAQTQFRGRIRIGSQDVGLLENAVARLAGDESDHAVVLYAQAGRVALVGRQALTAGNECPDIHVLLPGSTYEPETADTAVGCVNGHFLRDCVRSGFLSLRISDGFSPWLCEGDGGRHIVMPLRVDATQAVLAYAEARFGSAPASVQTTEAAPEAKLDVPTAGSAIPQVKQFPVDAIVPKPETHRKESTIMTGTPKMIEPITQTTPPADPLESLATRIDQVQDQLRDALNAVRDIRRAAKDLERDFRTRDKQLAAREREFEKSARLITRLQEAIAA